MSDFMYLWLGGILGIGVSTIVYSVISRVKKES